MSRTQTEKVELDQTIDTLVKKPNMYRVVMYGDSDVASEWVESILIQIFNYAENDAKTFSKMLSIESTGVVGVYTFEIAEQKIIEAKSHGSSKGYSLEFGIEKD